MAPGPAGQPMKAGPRLRRRANAGAMRPGPRCSRCLARLSARKRMIVVLRHYQQMKIQRDRRLLGCSQGSVKKQLFRALAQLRGGMDARPAEDETMKCKEFRDTDLLIPGRRAAEAGKRGIRRASPLLSGLRRRTRSPWKKLPRCSPERPRRRPGPGLGALLAQDRRRGRSPAAPPAGLAPFPRWALVAAGFLAFFILGVAFARLDFFPARRSVAGAGDAAFAFTARDYFSLLQPVMAEYGNAQASGRPGPRSRDRVRGLLNDLYLLKQRAEGSRDGALAAPARRYRAGAARDGPPGSFAPR